MAKVKITGHASGTGVFTVTAPNSNTDRTITLPDADVTLGTDATKLPLAGGTMTGQLIAPSIRTSGAVSGNFNTIINSTNQYGLNVVSTGTTGSHDILKIAGGNGTAFSVFGDNGATLTGNLIVGDTSSNESFIKISDDDTNAYVGAEGSAACFGMDSAIASGNNLRVLSDGRGLSQFTAKAWFNIKQTSTQSLRDSHNVSSVSDTGTGRSQINFANVMGSADYSMVVSSNGSGGSASGGSWGDTDRTQPAIFSQNTSNFTLVFYNTSTSYNDVDLVTGIVFGD